jgi:hypothetical protein
VKAKDKAKSKDKKAEPRDLRDGMVRVTPGDHRTVFDTPESDGGLGGVAPDSKEPPGQTTRE